MQEYSLSQIKSAYEQKKDWERQFPVDYFIVRPISFYLTYLIIRITKSPSRVAWVGFAIGLLGCFSFLFITHLTIWPGILLLIVFSILDAVDGNIARVTKNVTYYGKFLDGLFGVLIGGSYCFWLALGLCLNPGSNSQLVIILAGVSIMTGRLYGNKFEDTYYIHFISKQKETGSFQETLTATIQGSTYRKHWLYLLFINFQSFNPQLIILTLCALLNTVHLFLFLFAMYYLSSLLIKMVFYLREAHKKLS